MNEFDAAQFDALGPWITGFEFGGTQYGGQYRADTDSRILRFISRFRERLAALSASGITNVRLTKENLNEPSPALAQQNDAIFCVGLLYHLRQPAEFLARAAQATDFLWLSTIICAEPEATVVEGDYRGRLFGEAVAHPLAGVGPAIFSADDWLLGRYAVGGADLAKYRFWKNR